MSTTAFEFNGAKFVTNNYSAILDNDEAPKEFHLIQDFLAHSELMYALTQPELISPSQVLTLWRTANYDDGGENGSPSLTCDYEGQEYVVSPATIRKALHLPEEKKYDASVPTQTLRDMMIFLGYSASTDKMGELKRPHLCKEWSFFYDCITRAFGNKCSNFDAIPIFSQQIGYFLIHNLKFDIATSILRFIGDRRKENMNIVYYSRFCQLIFSYCFPDVPLPENENELPFKITKRAFTNLIKKDSKKNIVPVFAIPVTVQDKLKIALPDKSTKSPTKPSPPPRKRRFLQKISDSESEEDIPPPPPAKRLRKKIKPTSITDLTVEPPQSEDPAQALIPFSDQSAEPLLIEPISAMPLDTAAADEQMLESTSDHNDQTEGNKSVAERIAADTDISEKPSDAPSKSEDAQIEMVLQLIQDSLVQPDDIVAAPAQEIPMAENSEAATKALESHTLSIFLADIDDDEGTEVTSTPIQAPGLHSIISEPVRETTPERVDSPIKALSPVRESTPFIAPAVPGSPLPFSQPARRRICHLSYNHRMCRTMSPSVEDRLTSIEATQVSMHYTLADLSASVAQLVQVLTSADVKKGEKTFKDKCKPDQQMKRKKPDDDDEEKGEMSKQQKLLQIKETKMNSKEAASSERPPRESQKQKSMELTVVTQAQSISKAVRDSDAISKEIDLVNSEVKKKKDKLIAEAEKLIEVGDPESQKFCQTLKFRGKETTLFYKSPSLQAIDEAMARKIFEKENPGVDIDAIRLEEERLAAEKKKISKTKSDEQRQITDSSQKQKIPKQKGIVISEMNYTDINRPTTRSQTQTLSESDSKDKGKKPVDVVLPVPTMPKKSIITLAPENPTERMIKLSKNIHIIANISDQAEEKEAELVRRRKGEFKSISEKILTSDIAQVKVPVTEERIEDTKVSWLKLNTEKTQDDLKKKSLYGSLGTNLYKESPMLTRVRTHGTRGKEAYDTTGLGHRKEKIQTGSATTFRDPYPLTEKVGEAVTQKDLDKVESVQILMDTHDGPEDKEKIAIFLESGRVYRISEADLLLKSLRELEHFHMLEIKNKATQRWSDLMKKTISEKRRFYGIKSDDEYIPQIAQDDGSEISMEKNSSVMETIANTRILGYNNEADRPRVIQLGEAMKRSKANALRSAIYQTGDEDEELKTVKAQMIQTLKQIEEDLITKFVKE
ncbi:hypothetical protein ACET3Z_021301 [Daucus carota]